MPWTKESAIAELEKLISEIADLTQQRRFSADHTSWLLRTSNFLEQVFGQSSDYYITFNSFGWEETGSFIVGGPGDPEGTWNPAAAIERRNQQAYVQQLDSAKGLLLAAVNELQRSDLDGVYEGKDSGPESSVILKVINLAERKLRKAVRTVPTSEKEVQDAFENLLIGADLPYSRETDSIEYSSKTYTPDFTMSKIDLALELKLCSQQRREKEIIAEINDDILAYKTKYGNIMFIVYDVGVIRDIDRFIESFEQNEGVMVKVIKH
jgi:REase_DpnII-MboI